MVESGLAAESCGLSFQPSSELEMDSSAAGRVAEPGAAGLGCNPAAERLSGEASIAAAVAAEIFGGAVRSVAVPSGRT